MQAHIDRPRAARKCGGGRDRDRRGCLPPSPSPFPPARLHLRPSRWFCAVAVRSTRLPRRQARLTRRARRVAGSAVASAPAGWRDRPTRHGRPSDVRPVECQYPKPGARRRRHVMSGDDPSRCPRRQGRPSRCRPVLRRRLPSSHPPSDAASLLSRRWAGQTASEQPAEDARCRVRPEPGTSYGVLSTALLTTAWSPSRTTTATSPPRSVRNTTAPRADSSSTTVALGCP
ncbi:hypothetical protein UA75_08265 [Actinoalloteichus sp. GBA129-24]|nr:hypothetical protein UA75_08265 [Actinoalloteichus sp. GBA129-24]